MNNHKRLLIPLLLSLWTAVLPLSALNRQAIADTLTALIRQEAYVAPVEINRIRVQNNRVNIYTNRALSTVSLSDKQVRDIRLLMSELILGNRQGKISVYSDGYEIGELVTARYRHRPKQARYTLENTTPWVTNTSTPYTVSRGLNGKHIALWGSHGRYYHQDMQTWLWQRAKLWTTVEDVFTSSYTRTYLVPMLENAGAVVVQPRERDVQPVEQIVDDTEAQTVGNDVFVPAADAGWGRYAAPLIEQQNPFAMGHYRVAKSATKATGELRYIPSLAEGEYAVYVAYKTLPNSTDKACYTVVHKGQKTHFSVNQRMGSGTWVYLGTFAFDSIAANNYVSLTNADGYGQAVSADAVKFGGGMGDIARYPQPEYIGNIPSSQHFAAEDIPTVDSAQLKANQALATVSGMPRYLEGARYWMQYAGIPDSVYNFTGSRNDYVDDYAARGEWVNYLAGGSVANPKQAGLHVPLHASLAFHTDAGVKRHDSIVGTLLIYTDHDDLQQHTYPAGGNRLINRDLGDYVQTQITQDLQGYCPHWTRRQLNNASYAEARRPKVPAILLELLSHQNFNDMRFGLDPRVKFTVSRAIYKGILRFMHEQYGSQYVVQPLPVQAMQMQRTDNTIRVSWQPTEDPIEPTATPAYYVVYTRKDNGDWDNGVKVTTAAYSFTAEQGVQYAIRVAAGNAGGISLPSEILAAYIAPEEKGRVLILNGFTRVSGPEWFEDSLYAGIYPQAQAVPYGRDISYIGEQYDYRTTAPWNNDEDSGWGACYSDHQTRLTAGNTFDYPVLHGRVLAAAGYSYISSSVAVDSIAGCDMVDVILGKQKTTVLGTDTAFHCMPPALQRLLTDYLERGGRVLLSGAYIAGDMQSAADKAFIRDYLHYDYRASHASRVGEVRVESGLPTGTYAFRSTPNEERLHTENPDGLLPVGGNTYRIARYTDTGVIACVGYRDPQPQGSRTLCWSFMLESAQDFDTLYRQSVDWLLQ